MGRTPLVFVIFKYQVTNIIIIWLIQLLYFNDRLIYYTPSEPSKMTRCLADTGF